MDTLHHTATHCNTAHHTVPHCTTGVKTDRITLYEGENRAYYFVWRWKQSVLLCMNGENWWNIWTEIHWLIKKNRKRERNGESKMKKREKPGCSRGNWHLWEHRQAALSLDDDCICHCSCRHLFRSYVWAAWQLDTHTHTYKISKWKQHGWLCAWWANCLMGSMCNTERQCCSSEMHCFGNEAFGSTRDIGTETYADANGYTWAVRSTVEETLRHLET